MRIVQHSEIKEYVRYCREFAYSDNLGWGFSFECDVNGNLVEQCEKYGECIQKVKEGKMIDMGIKKYEWTYTEPAVGLCNYCNQEVVLHGFTNTCECGVDYDSSGNELAPRSQWGEETGECWFDII